MVRERSEGGGEVGVKMKAEREAMHGPFLGKTGVVSGKPVFLTVHWSRDEKSFLVTGREIQDPSLHGSCWEPAAKARGLHPETWPAEPFQSRG